MRHGLALRTGALLGTAAEADVRLWGDGRRLVVQRLVAVEQDGARVELARLRDVDLRAVVVDDELCEDVQVGVVLAPCDVCDRVAVWGVSAAVRVKEARRQRQVVRVQHFVDARRPPRRRLDESAEGRVARVVQRVAVDVVEGPLGDVRRPARHAPFDPEPRRAARHEVEDGLEPARSDRRRVGLQVEKVVGAAPRLRHVLVEHVRRAVRVAVLRLC
mmetsp:Transcript_29706/g.100038  ORF Transcript_29706/g.100038 Transcript_29706/m.100038 type:complete len:217 (-) Transcript_29706:284-934(-)